MSIWNGNSYIIPAISVFFPGKGLLGTEEDGAGDCKERGILPEMHRDALPGYVSKEDMYS